MSSSSSSGWLLEVVLESECMELKLVPRELDDSESVSVFDVSVLSVLDNGKGSNGNESRLGTWFTPPCAICCLVRAFS
jgi:hypothetical protein